MNSQFVEENINLIYYLSDRIGGRLTREERKDLAQEVATKILESKERALQESASAYVSRVMKNVILNKMRDDQVDAMWKADSLDAPVNDEDGNKTPRIEVTPGRDTVDTEATILRYKQDVYTVVRYLPAVYAKIFFMKHYMGMTLDDIVSTSKFSLGKVKQLSARSAKKARDLVKRLPSYKGRFDGLTLREMCLCTLPDKILFPFNLKYIGEESLIDISKLTGRTIDDLKIAIATGERMIKEEYQVDVQR